MQSALYNLNDNKKIEIPQQHNSILVFETGDYITLNAKTNNQYHFGEFFFASGNVDVNDILDRVNNHKIIYVNSLIVSKQIEENDSSVVDQQRMILFRHKPENETELISYNFGYTPNVDELERITSKKESIKCCVYTPFEKLKIINLNDILEKIHTNVEYIENIPIPSQMTTYATKHSIEPTRSEKNAIKIWGNSSFLKKKKTIILLNFEVSKTLLNLLSIFFNVIVSKRDTTVQEIQMIKADGVIISNSIHSVKKITNNELENIKKIIESQIPILGFEFGACVIAKALGMKIEKSTKKAMYYRNYGIVTNEGNKIYKTSKENQEKIINNNKDNIEVIAKDKDNYISIFSVKNTKAI
ncbi:MAG: Glutamine amidotransferase class-I, partial [Pseudomonadota bacterium]